MISANFEPEVVILCAGDYPSHNVSKGILCNAFRLICCDGASMEYITKEGKSPWRIIGDGDSVAQDFKDKYKDIYIRIAEQDYNDQTKAVRYSAEQGYKKIAIVGATGKREDHTLGNISLLMDYLNNGIEARIYTDHGFFVACSGDNCFDVPIGSAVSFFNFGAKELRSEGLQYPLYDFTKLWQGTLNKVTASPFLIKAKGEYLVFIKYK